MTAVPKLPDLKIPGDSSAALAQLRHDLARRFPGVVIAPSPILPGGTSLSAPSSLLLQAPFAWVEVAIGDGGLAWLAAWTALAIARDPLGRPALWVDTHGTFSPGDLLDLEGKLVVVRPPDPHEAHVAADIALRSGSFCMIALEMHRALHPKPLARLSRLASARSPSDRTRTPLVLWGEPPSFVAPPSGVPRTPFSEAIHALYEGLAQGAQGARGDRSHDEPDQESSPFDRALHTTDRLRPLDRAADRRASASVARPTIGIGSRVDEHPDRPFLGSLGAVSSIPYSRPSRPPLPFSPRR